MSESIALGDWRLLFLNRDRIEQVTAADVARVAAYYLKPANRTVGIFMPDASPDRTVVPEAPDLAALLQDYKGRAPIAPGEDFDASPANIEKRTTRGQLANGLKFALLLEEDARRGGLGHPHAALRQPGGARQSRDRRRDGGEHAR